MVNKKTGPVTLSSFTYTLDATGNRTQMVDLSGTHSYQYDPLYRLTQVTYPGPQTDTYTYDAVGNRLTKNAASYTYDSVDEMLTAGGVTYVYDSNGNQTGRGSDTFSYDHENRLTQTVIAGATSTSTYNGDGLRMSHTVSGQATNYTWDINASLPVVLQDGTNTYVYGLDLISSTDGSGVQTYFTYDGLGSTADLTDGSGNTVATYSYDVFGAIRSQSGSSSNYWLFTGEQQDADSGFYFLRARHYDPLIARFLGEDSFAPILEDPRTFNRFSYVTNNPVNHVDPSGLTWTTPKNVVPDSDKEGGFKTPASELLCAANPRICQPDQGSGPGSYGTGIEGLQSCLSSIMDEVLYTAIAISVLWAITTAAMPYEPYHNYLVVGAAAALAAWAASQTSLCIAHYSTT